METLCTIICIDQEAADYDPPHSSLDICVPLKEAIQRADILRATWPIVRVYAETNNGATLTLIYMPTKEKP